MVCSIQNRTGYRRNQGVCTSDLFDLLLEKGECHRLRMTEYRAWSADVFFGEANQTYCHIKDGDISKAQHLLVKMLHRALAPVKANISLKHSGNMPTKQDMMNQRSIKMILEMVFVLGVSCTRPFASNWSVICQNLQQYISTNVFKPIQS